MRNSPATRNQKPRDPRLGAQDSRVILLGKGWCGTPDGFDDETYSLASETTWWADLFKEGDR